MSKEQSDNTNNATKNFDKTAIADRLRTVIILLKQAEYQQSTKAETTYWILMPISIKSHIFLT